MEEFHECLVCGASPYFVEDVGGWNSLHCHSCGANGPRRRSKDGAVIAYNRHCELIVSRALAEALKVAVIMHVPAGAVWAGSKDVAPGLYALIPVKDAKP